MYCAVDACLMEYSRESEIIYELRNSASLKSSDINYCTPCIDRFGRGFFTSVLKATFEVNPSFWPWTGYGIIIWNLPGRTAPLEVDLLNKGLIQRGFEYYTPRGTTPNMPNVYCKYITNTSTYLEHSQDIIFLQRVWSKVMERFMFCIGY